MDGWMGACRRDGWMDVHGLVTLHYPLIFMKLTLSDVMDGCMGVWMDIALSPSICSWPCHPPLSSHRHDNVRCDGWTHGCVDGHGLVTFHHPPMYVCDEWMDVGGMDGWFVMALSPSVILSSDVMDGWMDVWPSIHPSLRHPAIHHI